MRVVAHHGLPVVLGLGELPAVRCRVLHPLAEERRLVHELLRDAPAPTSGEGWTQGGAKVRARLRSVAAHPTLTQVPPRPQVVPCGVGLTKSQTATFLPYLAAALEQARPPEPPPITCARRGARSGALAVPGPLMPTGANGMRALTFSGAGLAAGARAVRVARTVAARAAEHRCGRTG